MAEQTAKCGKTTIRYPSDCAFKCDCKAHGGGCTWSVTCKGYTTSGTGFQPPKPPKFPHVTIAGNLDAIAQMLQKDWKRPVIVPEELRGRTIRKRTFKGTPKEIREEIADALGLQVGSKKRKG